MGKFKAKTKDGKTVMVNAGIATVAIILVSSVVLLLIQLLVDDENTRTILSMVTGSIESLGTTTTILLAIIQFKDENEISTASFIRELNNNYTINKGNIFIYENLSACINHECEEYAECHKNNNHVCIYQKTQKFTRADVSNYLTFFETIYLLYKKNAIDIDVIDELFSSRFFLAAHSKVVQDLKLYSQTNFYNIYALEHLWIKYKMDIGKMDKNKYLASVKAYRDLRHGLITTDDAEKIWGDGVYYSRPLSGLFDSDMDYNFFLNNRKLIGENLKGFRISVLKRKDLNKIMKFQEMIFNNLEDKSFLRNNSREMFKDCLKRPNLTLGLFDDSYMVGFTILYDPAKHPEEDLSHFIKDKKDNVKVLHYKNVMIDPNYRGHGLQVLLEKELEKHINRKKEVLLCATVHANNIASVKSIQKCGFIYATSTNKYGLPRDVYYKYLPAIEK